MGAKTIFENKVRVKTKDDIIIESEFVEYDREKGFLIIKKDIKVNDKNNNTIKTNYAEYDENTESTGYSVNTYGLVAYLTKALQETISKVEILENKVSTLEGA